MLSSYSRKSFNKSFGLVGKFLSTIAVKTVKQIMPSSFSPQEGVLKAIIKIQQKSLELIREKFFMIPSTIDDLFELHESIMENLIEVQIEFPTSIITAVVIDDVQDTHYRVVTGACDDGSSL